MTDSNDKENAGVSGVASSGILDEVIAKTWDAHESPPFNELGNGMKEFLRKCFNAGYNNAKGGKARWPRAYRSVRLGAIVRDAGWLYFQSNNKG